MHIYYIVGKLTNYETQSWEIIGLFSTKELALEYCFRKKDVNLFIGPLELNNPLPYEQKEWVGAFYPNVERN